jgi:superfamily I DNA/RNA helicase
LQQQIGRNARKGGHLTYDQIERIYGYMSEKHAEKQKLKGMIKDSLYVLEMMKAYYGLNTDAVWYEAFDNAPRRDVQYLRKMRRNGEKLNEAPRITLSTIHGAKGGECENVVLLTDLSLNTMKSYEQNQMMRIDYSMLVRHGPRNIYTSLNQNKNTKDTIYDK